MECQPCLDKRIEGVNLEIDVPLEPRSWVRGFDGKAMSIQLPRIESVCWFTQLVLICEAGSLVQKDIPPSR